MNKDNMDSIRVDVSAAMKRFREEFLPSAEIDPEALSGEHARPGSARSSGSLPMFLAAFTADKKLSPQEEEEIRRMIDDFRKEM